MIAGVLGGVMQGFSMIMGGAAEAQGQRYKAQQSERAAEIGKIQADQIDTSYRDELGTTIANIRAIRAATGANPDSPSTTAYIQDQATASDRTRRIRVGGARMQATQDLQDAHFYRSSASSALLGGVAKGLPYFIGAFA